MSLGRSPQLRVAVIPLCNLHCFYCHPEGEGYGENPNERMTPSEIAGLVTASTTAGITHLKFTGGEPLLRKDIVEIIVKCRAVVGIQEIQMVTNGTLLSRSASALRAAGLDSITISVDAADENIYARVRGGKLGAVLEGLAACQQIGLPIRINTVLSRSNFEQVEPMMSLAERFGASLKLLDLMDLQLPGSRAAWEREFVPFSELHTLLKGHGAEPSALEEAPGGVGAPLIQYVMPSGLHVLVKDSTAGTCYHESCYSCRFYPCQDALISLRVTHDGHLKRCLIRNDNLADVLTPLRSGDVRRVEQLVQESVDILAGSRYFPAAWQPNLPTPRLRLTLPVLDS